MRIVIADSSEGQLLELKQQADVAGSPVADGDALLLTGKTPDRLRALTSRLSQAPDLLLVHYTWCGGLDRLKASLAEHNLSRTRVIFYSGDAGVLRECPEVLPTSWVSRYDLVLAHLRPFVEECVRQGFEGWPGNVPPAVLADASYQGIAVRHAYAICAPLAAAVMRGQVWNAAVEDELWAAWGELREALKRLPASADGPRLEAPSVQQLLDNVASNASATAQDLAWERILCALRHSLGHGDGGGAVDLVRDLEEALFSRLIGLSWASSAHST